MKARVWLAVLVIAVAWTWTAAACIAGEEKAPKGKDADSKEKEKDALAEFRRQITAMRKGMTTFVGDTRLSEASIQSILKHAPSFHAVGEGEEDHDEIETLLETTYKKTGVYDFSLIIGVKELQAWARGRGVNATTWFRSMMRAQCLFMRADMLKNLQVTKKQAAAQLADLEKARKQIGEETYKSSRKLIEDGVKMATEMAKSAALIPAPTAVETKLLSKHATKLRVAVEGPDDTEDEMGDG